MKTDAKFRDFVKDQCMNNLIKRGFIQFRKGSVHKDIDGNFKCWVGLNSGIYTDSVHLEPFVGIHVVDMGRAIALLRGEAGPKYDSRVATYAVHMGELAPEEAAFRFCHWADAHVEGERLADLYDRVGFPYSQSIASYEALLPLLDERTPTLGGYPERYAYCLYKLGRSEEAVEYMRKLADEFDHLKIFCRNFVTFCEKAAS